MIDCRLCRGPAKRLWGRRVLDKYEVDYFECERCGSLQTEEPYWLDEAYAEPGAGFDTGACQRSLDSALTLSAALEVIGLNRQVDCLDFGAGTGIFARMMRDRGWRFFAYETYAFPHYMDQFRAAPADRPWALVTAFEVFEHLSNPAVDLDAILLESCDLVFLTTELWEGQGPDWPYLNPVQGQHVFFYSPRAMDMVAQRYGFIFGELGFVKCFSRPAAHQRLEALRQVDFGQWVLQSIIRHSENPFQYAARDHEDLMVAHIQKQSLRQNTPQSDGTG